MGKKIQFHPLDIRYRIVDGKAVIHLFGRTLDGQQIVVLDDSFEPYFWAVLKRKADIDKFQEKIVKIEVEGKQKYRVVKTETKKRTYLGQEVDAIKIYTNLPAGVPAIKDVIKDWDMIKELHEYDVLFVRRYLIDKGIIMWTTVEAEGEFINQRMKVGVFKAEKIEQVSDDSIEDPRILAFDIETYNPFGKGVMPEKNPIIMIAFHSKNFNKVITWKKFKTKHAYVEFVESEAALLQRFKEIIDTFKPDILCGYYSDGFDLPYIRTRAEKYKVKLDIGLDYSTMSQRRGNFPSVEISGIVHVDVFKFIRTVMRGTLETDTYSLNEVAAEILGEKKLEVDLDNLADAWDNDPKKLEEFCEYNLKDANLTYKLCLEILPNMEEMAKVTGLPLFDVGRMGFSQLVEGFILRNIDKELSPNRPSHDEIKKRHMQTYKGGFVYEPKPGLYKDIVIFDFRSLYPTIITSHNVSPDTLNCRCCEDTAQYAPTDKNEFWFCKKKKGFIPLLIGDLIKRRMRIKEISSKAKDKTQKKLLDARSNSLKLLANSMYGYYGFFGARWYSVECARSITAWGRHYIQMVIEKAKKQEFNVVYGDTDSVFMTLEKKKKKDALEFAKKINDKLPGMMELEYEGHYPSGIFVSAKQGAYGAKKRYALMDEDKNLRIKGFETIRRNVSFIAKEVQEKVLRIILGENNPKKAFEFVKKTIHELRDKKVPIDKVVIFTQLQRDVKSYTAIGPHVAVAQRMIKQGYEVGPGSMIKYVVTEGSGRIRDRARLPQEIKEKEYDAEYYIKNQVVPAVEKIFEVLGYEKDDLLESKDQSKLNKFF